MILKRFYDDKLAQASFLIGCARTGEATVIDPNRDVEQYVEAASYEGLRISVVTETHIHADYVSGSRELAHRTGATLFLSSEGGPDWQYEFASEGNVKLVRDGDSIRVGNIRLDVVKTPGHTPEHITFILTDEPASADPLCAFTGDFIFVGDVGRPDLLERAAGLSGTMEDGAKTLYRSLHAFFSAYPAELILWPAHGSGSACGKSLGGVPVTTLGYERKTNAGLRPRSESDFVDSILAGQPEPPVYFKEMKRMNKVGPPLLGGFRTPPRLGGRKILDLIDSRATIVDVRSAGEAAVGFIPAVLNISAGKSFTNWAGWLLPYDQPIYLIAPSQDVATEVTRDLAMIGIDTVSGWFGLDALREYERNRPLEVLPQIGPKEMRRQQLAGLIEVLDVRGESELLEGHVPGASNIPLGYLSARADSLPAGKPIAVLCQAGTRSPIGASLLRKLGYPHVLNLTGGYLDYVSEGLPIEIDNAPAQPARV